MPLLIQSIDAIAREKQRDVLFVRFTRLAFPEPDNLRPVTNWKRCQARREFLTWCTATGIAVAPCGPPSQSGWLEGYFGDVYVDVPFDEADPLYQGLASHLEHPDGRMKLAHTAFMCMALEQAMMEPKSVDD